MRWQAPTSWSWEFPSSWPLFPRKHYVRKTILTKAYPIVLCVCAFRDGTLDRSYDIAGASAQANLTDTNGHEVKSYALYINILRAQICKNINQRRQRDATPPTASRSTTSKINDGALNGATITTAAIASTLTLCCRGSFHFQFGTQTDRRSICFTDLTAGVINLSSQDVGVMSVNSLSSLTFGKLVPDSFWWARCGYRFTH